MKALVVRQPWASLIALEVKTIETRGFRPRTSLAPGDDLAIVAGKKPGTEPGEDLGDSGWYYESTEGDPSCVVNWKLPATFVDAPLGAVVAVVRYDGALPMEPCPPYSSSFDDAWEPDPASVIYLGGLDGGPWAFIDGDGPIPLTDQLPLGDFTPGRYGWLLSNVRPLSVPVPVTGRQGVFSLPDEVAAQVREQVGS